MFKSLNYISRFIHRSLGGMPKPLVYFYNAASGRVLGGFHSKVFTEINHLKVKGWIVDIGAGPGTILNWLARMGHYRLAGIDISFEMAKIALKIFNKSKVSHSVDYIIGDGQLLPIRNNSVNLVFSTLTLHYIRKMHKFILNALGAIKVGGIFLTYEFNFNFLKEKSIETARIFKVNYILARIISTIHGIPIDEFEQYYKMIMQIVKLFGGNAKIIHRGIITMILAVKKVSNELL